ncbi:MAG: hypothetical protein D6694_07120 [Gammaproteobacteria bacterium]|nr:MAG: hypothetical protein D6694_07120 [Gammaproteobacteria bacterium]
MKFSSRIASVILFLGLSGYAALPTVDISKLPVAAREPVKALQKLLADKAKADTPEQKAELLGRMGMVLHSAEQLALAAEYYRAAMQQAPKDARWYYLYGVVQAARGQLDSAYAALRMSFDLKSDYLPTLARIGEIALQKGDYDEATRIANVLIKEAPFAAFGHELLGQVAAASNRPEEAVSHFRKVLKNKPFANRVYYPLAIQLRKLGRIDEAKAAIARRGEIAPGYPDPLMRVVRNLVPTPERLLEEGLALAKSGRFQQAEDKYRQGLTLASDHPGLNTALAYIELRQGKVDEAKTRLKSVLAKQPDYVPAIFKLAEIADASNEHDEALRRYQHVLKIQPDNADAAGELAAMLMRIGQFSQAAEQFEHFAALKPENVKGHFLAGLAWLAAGHCQHGLARLKQAKQLNPSDGAVMLALSIAMVDCQSDDSASAAAIAKAVYEAAPGFESARVLAWHKAREGKWQDAIDYQTQAIFEVLKHGLRAKYPELAEQLSAYRQKKLPQWNWRQYARQWAPDAPQIVVEHPEQAK